MSAEVYLAVVITAFIMIVIGYVGYSRIKIAVADQLRQVEQKILLRLLKLSSAECTDSVVTIICEELDGMVHRIES